MSSDTGPTSPRFDYSLLLERLGDASSRFNIDHLDSCTSTNTLLLERAARGAPTGTTLVTDTQTAGRGRRGRNWISSPEYSLAFSLLWKFPGRPSLGGLSLAVGVAVAQALEGLGIVGTGLKWPNDIWLFGRKLGGVLIEVFFDSSHAGVVIGIGLNLRRNPAWTDLVAQPLATLEDAGEVPVREILLAAILRRLQAVLDAFAVTGFRGVRAEWEARNALHGLPVRVESESGEHLGTCLGVAEDGALELQQASGARLLITGGDVSLKPDSGSPVPT